MSDVIGKAAHWAGEHPVPMIVGVLGLGAVFILLTRPSNAGAADSGMAGFYAAQSAQAASGNSLMAVQNQDATAVAINGQNTSAAVAINADNNTTSRGQTAAAVTVDAQNNATTLSLANILYPKATPTSVASPEGYVPFSPFNTANPSQPLFQGNDSLIATEIDQGLIKLNGDVAATPVGTYALTSPIDQRWAAYSRGSYTSTGAPAFTNPLDNFNAAGVYPGLGA
jgi:hypothetical protein